MYVFPACLSAALPGAHTPLTIKHPFAKLHKQLYKNIGNLCMIAVTYTSAALDRFARRPRSDISASHMGELRAMAAAAAAEDRRNAPALAAAAAAAAGLRGVRASDPGLVAAGAGGFGMPRSGSSRSLAGTFGGAASSVSGSFSEAGGDSLRSSMNGLTQPPSVNPYGTQADAPLPAHPSLSGMSDTSGIAYAANDRQGVDLNPGMGASFAHSQASMTGLQDAGFAERLRAASASGAAGPHSDPYTRSVSPSLEAAQQLRPSQQQGQYQQSILSRPLQNPALPTYLFQHKSHSTDSAQSSVNYPGSELTGSGRLNHTGALDSGVSAGTATASTWNGGLEIRSSSSSQLGLNLNMNPRQVVMSELNGTPTKHGTGGSSGGGAQVALKRPIRSLFHDEDDDHAQAEAAAARKVALPGGRPSLKDRSIDSPTTPTTHGGSNASANPTPSPPQMPGGAAYSPTGPAVVSASRQGTTESELVSPMLPTFPARVPLHDTWGSQGSSHDGRPPVAPPATALITPAVALSAAVAAQGPPAPPLKPGVTVGGGGGADSEADMSATQSVGDHGYFRPSDTLSATGGPQSGAGLAEEGSSAALSPTTSNQFYGTENTNTNTGASQLSPPDERDRAMFMNPLASMSDSLGDTSRSSDLASTGGSGNVVGAEGARPVRPSPLGMQQAGGPGLGTHPSAQVSECMRLTHTHTHA